MTGDGFDMKCEMATSIWLPLDHVAEA